MRTFLVRGASVFTAAVVSLALSAGSVNAGGSSGGPSDRPHKSGGITAVVRQVAHNSNATRQSSEANVDNRQKNWNSPISVLTLGSKWSPGSKGPKGCGCDEHPYPDSGHSKYEQPSAGNVDQSNTADNTAKSVVENGTDQSVSQTGSATATGGDDCGCKWPEPSGYEAHSTAPSDPCGCEGPQGPKHPDGGDYHSTPPGPAPGCGCDGGGQPAGGGGESAAVGQHGSNENQTSQQSSASVDNTQTNINLPITILSAGSGNGDVNQGNEADNTAKSATANGTDQSVDQDGDATASGGDGCGCDDTKAAVGQSGSNANSTQQQSQAGVENRQTNINLPITILSFGSNNGDVNQGNQADNTAKSTTTHGTDQSVDQTGDATAASDGDDGCGCAEDHAVVGQSGGNSNQTDQQSAAQVDNHQTNVNLPITILSAGSGNGDVSQSNSASNTAVSGVFNGTGQAIVQTATALIGG